MSTENHKASAPVRRLVGRKYIILIQDGECYGVVTNEIDGVFNVAIFDSVDEAETSAKYSDLINLWPYIIVPFIPPNAKTTKPEDKP